MKGTLREQIFELCARRVNQQYADALPFPRQVAAMAALAFIERWDQNSVDALAIRKAWELLNSDSASVPLDEESVKP